jgi:Fibronectin type III domain
VNAGGRPVNSANLFLLRKTMPVGHRTTRVVLTLAVVLALAGVVPGPCNASGPTATAPGAPVLTAAAVNTSTITATWSTPSGTVTNYTLEYARFYGVPIASLSVGTKTVHNLTGLGFGLTYYLTVWAWNGSTEGPPSNVAAVQTDQNIGSAPTFPWQDLDAITTLSLLGSIAISVALATYIAGKRSQQAEGAAAIALARTARRGHDGTIDPVGRHAPSRRSMR